MKKITKLLATAIVLIVLSMAHMDSKASSDEPWYLENHRVSEFRKVIDYKIGEKIDLTIPSTLDGAEPSDIILLKLNSYGADTISIIGNGNIRDNIYVFRDDAGSDCSIVK